MTVRYLDSLASSDSSEEATRSHGASYVHRCRVASSLRLILASRSQAGWRPGRALCPGRSQIGPRSVPDRSQIGPRSVPDRSPGDPPCTPFKPKIWLDFWKKCLISGNRVDRPFFPYFVRKTGKTAKSAQNRVRTRFWTRFARVLPSNPAGPEIPGHFGQEPGKNCTRKKCPNVHFPTK